MSAANNTIDMPFRGIWRATVLARRKEGVTKEEFSRRFARHGKLAGPVVIKHNVISYVQHHLTERHAVELKDNLGPELAPHFTFPDVDGITMLVFPTAEDMAGFFRDPAHGETLNADVAEFADVTTVRFSVGDELPIVQDGKMVV